MHLDRVILIPSSRTSLISLSLPHPHLKQIMYMWVTNNNFMISVLILLYPLGRRNVRYKQYHTRLLSLFLREQIDHIYFVCSLEVRSMARYATATFEWKCQNRSHIANKLVVVWNTNSSKIIRDRPRTNAFGISSPQSEGMQYKYGVFQWIYL